MTRDKATITAFLTGAMLAASGAHAQRAVGNWTAPGNDPGHSGWQKAESTLTADAISSQFKLLWKLKLGNGETSPSVFTEPLLAPRLINAQGFKDFVYVASADTLYAVDSELGKVLWTKHYDAPSARGACGEAPLGIAMEPPVVINFAARRPASAPTPAVPAPPPSPTERKLGMSGGGGFGLRGIYVLTPDGMLHEQVLTTGADFGPSVKFLPGTQGGERSLNIVGKTAYTVTQRGCGASKDAVWALNFATTDYQVKSAEVGGIQDVMGPTAGSGNVFVVTGDGAAPHPSSILALSGADLSAADWYSPQGKLARISPVAFGYKDQQLVAAPGPDGAVVLLDAKSLGGADHHTPLATSGKLTSAATAWGGLSVWADASGATYLYASVADGARGKLEAFRIEDQGGKLALTPAWHVDGVVNPAPAVTGNGVLTLLAEGDAKTHAKLLVLDAASGKQLFSSGDSIPADARLSGLSMGDGHIFFTTHDNTLYCFGIGIEH